MDAVPRHGINDIYLICVECNNNLRVWEIVAYPLKEPDVASMQYIEYTTC